MHYGGDFGGGRGFQPHPDEMNKSRAGYDNEIFSKAQADRPSMLQHNASREEEHSFNNPPPYKQQHQELPRPAVAYDEQVIPTLSNNPKLKAG